MQLAWFDRTGRRLATVGKPDSFLQVRLSPDEQKAALLRTDPGTNTNDLWMMDLRSSGLTKISSVLGDPIWSPDGRRLAFYRTGRIVERSIDGGDEVVLFAPNDIAASNPEYWTKEGIVFRRGGGVFRLPLTGDRTPVALLPPVAYGRNQIQVSPDGSRVAFTSNETGRPEVWIASFPDFRQRQPISIEGGDIPRWRRDMRELFYMSPDGILMSVDLTTGVDIEASVPRRLFETRVILTGGFDQYAVTGDGQRFLLLEIPDTLVAPPITVITNWTALLERR